MYRLSVSWKFTRWNLFPSTKQWQKNQSQDFLWCMPLKRAVLNGSKNSRFKFLLNFFVRGRIKCFFHKSLIIDRGHARIQHKYLWDDFSFIRRENCGGSISAFPGI